MNDYSSYSSAPPSEASAKCQSTIDNVTRWLQQYESETELSETRTNLFEAELTRRLAKLKATGNNTSSLSRSEQSIAYPEQQASSPRPSQVVQLTRQPFAYPQMTIDSQQRPPSVASSIKRGWDSYSTGSSKQPRISDPKYNPGNGHVPEQAGNFTAQQNGSSILTPPLSAPHSTDIAPPLPPRLENGNAPPLPPRPYALATGAESGMLPIANMSYNNNNMKYSFQVSKLNNARLPHQRPAPFVDGRCYSMPPAPPASVTSSVHLPEQRVISLPPASNSSMFRGSNFNGQQFFPKGQGGVNGSQNFQWSQPMSSAGFSTNSHAVSNLNYSVFPDGSIGDSQALSCESISFNGSNYALYDSLPKIPAEGSRPGNQISTHNVFIHSAPPSTLQPRPHKVTISPLPERRQRNSMRIEERESYSNSRTYSSEAYKFFMEQHVENLIKSCAERKERQEQFEAYMTSQNLNTEAERRPFRVHNAKRESQYLRLKRTRLQPSFFEPLKVLGIGAFGEVSLVKKRDSGKLYAMKTLRKADVIKRNQVAHVKAERDILAEANSDWVVKLFFSFQDRENLYFIMDYIPGGDLMNLLIKKGFFSEPMARFYTAELVAALEYVHSMGFIHRDIKPDNVLIDREGHVKLTDFGLCTGFRWTHQSNRYAKIRPEEPIWISPPQSNHHELRETSSNMSSTTVRHRRVHSLVGTPNYIAPEVVLKSGYNHSCDWWSVGVILYEMLLGQPPFMSDTPESTQYKIIHWKQYLNFPYGLSLSPAAADLITALIRDADSRLGASGGAADIKAHAFFNSVDFDKLRKQPAVYVPVLKHEMDTSNFDPSTQGGQQSLTDDNLTPTGSLSQAPFSFYEFTFRRFCDDAGCPLPTPLSVAQSTSVEEISSNSTEITTASSETVDTVTSSSKPPLPPPLPPRPNLPSQQKPSTPTVSSAKPLPSPIQIEPSIGGEKDKNPTFV